MVSNVVINEISELLDDNDKIKFSNELLKNFTKYGLGVLSKADFEAFLYYLLKKHKKREVELGKFDWIRLLKLTPTKLNSMQLLSSVRFEELADKKNELIEDLVKELASNVIEIDDIEKQQLRLYISDMHLLLFIQSFASEHGYVIKQTRNPNELIIQFNLFLLLLDEIESFFKGKFRLRTALKKSLNAGNQTNELKETLKTRKKFTTFFKDKLINETEKQGYSEVVKLIGNTSLQLLMEFIKN